MPVHVTFHELLLSRDPTGVPVPVLGRRLSARNAIAVGAAAVNSSAAPQNCLAKITATEACVVEIGAADAAVAAASEYWAAGERDIRCVGQGQFVSVRTAA